MTEDVLQFIWQSQSFQTSSLVTTAGDNVKVYHQGKLNIGSGPDFTEARIKINDLEWSGDIEIHTYASLWDKHNHNQDSAYDKVILHVVWQEDSVVSRSDNTIIPTIELKNWLDEGWLEKYNKLMQSLIAVPCKPYLEVVDPLVVQDAIHIALVERLELRSEKVRQILRQWQGDWEKTALIMLFKVKHSSIWPPLLI